MKESVIHLTDLYNKISSIFVYDNLEHTDLFLESLESEDEVNQFEDWFLNLFKEDEDKALEFLYGQSKELLNKVENLNTIIAVSKLDKKLLNINQLNKLKNFYNQKFIISKEDIVKIIKDLKQCDKLFLANRDINNDFITKYNLSSEDCLDIIHSLNIRDYYRSSIDTNYKYLGNSLIIFEKKDVIINNIKIDKLIIYIKINLTETFKKNAVCAVSFHETSAINNLPYKEKDMTEDKNEPINEDLTEEEQKQADAIVKFIDDLYKLRQESIAKDGEYGIGNLVFKEIRNRGILDKLKDKLRELTSKELSLESLEEDKEVDKSINLDDFDILLVDDALKFNINDWEEKLAYEVQEEFESSKTASDSKFIKYRLDKSLLLSVIDKLKSSDFSIVDGKTSWKTRQFLKKKNLTLKDLTEILHNIEVEDYKVNSIPASSEEEGYNEAIVFVKKSKIKDFGPFKLYIKLDYDSIEEQPVIIISIHE